MHAVSEQRFAEGSSALRKVVIKTNLPKYKELNSIFVDSVEKGKGV
jgi:hypothetical protein